jgi:P4 family phage/plasmid primase-like protien
MLTTPEEAKYQQAKFILDDFNPQTEEDFKQIKNQSEGKIVDADWSRYKNEKNIIDAGKIFTPKGQAKVFTDIQPLFYDKNGMWWLWNSIDFKWQIVDEVDILNMIAEATGEDVINPKNRTIILNSLKQEGRKHIPEPIKPTWIQFKDTFFDINTGERFKANYKYFVTNPIPYELHNENVEATPVMDKIFEEWVGKEYVRTLYEILAYSMMPDYPINRLFCFIGAGMNGKSKYLELLRKFVGGENCCTTELDTLLASRFEITRLHKKLVCMMGETNFNEMSKTSILKKLTGGDLIGFEYKNKNPFDETNYAKILIATNNLPTTTDKTIGFYRRWMIIDFPNQFSEQRDILADIPEEEYSALALKCCMILKELLQQRAFTNEGSVEVRMERYEAKSNFLDKFLKEYTEQDGASFITSAEFFKRFQSWCKENKHRDMSEISVGMAMKKAGYETEKKYFNWMYDGKGGQARCFVNVKWKN